MKTYFLNVWDTIRTSYWFVPSLFAASALLLTIALPQLDAMLAASEVSLPDWIRTTTEAARATLSAMAGAMVAVTGTVFSITIVTLSLTSQQFGPRLLRRFMVDLTTQVTLGGFLSTGLYCLLLLRIVEHDIDGDAAEVVPHLSVLAAVVLSIVSMAMLIVFIHHIAILIQAPQVVAAVARDLDDAIERLFPEKIGEAAGEQEDKSGGARGDEAELGQPYGTIPSTSEGYVQAVAGGSLMRLATEAELILRLRFRPGDFVAIDSPLADFWLTGADAIGETGLESLRCRLNDAVLVGVRRTPRQDVECAVEELVEIAIRALSPGINDPFTAINCIDRLGASLGRLADRVVPTAYRCDEDGRLRIIAHPRRFSDVMDAAFNQIRQYGSSSVAVTTRLLEALASIAEHVVHEEDRAAVRRHAGMVFRQAESYAERFDKQAVDERYTQIKQRLMEVPVDR